VAKDRIIQIIRFYGLLLGLMSYALRTINFNEYDCSFSIKAMFFIAAFLFTVSIFIGTLAYYITKSAYPLIR
jgi:hypothetical protein